MSDEVDRKLDEEYVTPHLREGEGLVLRLSTTTSRGGWARFLDALGPFAIFIEAFFSSPAFAVLTDQRLLVSHVTILKKSQYAESIDFAEVERTELKRGPFHKAVSVRTKDGRRYRMTVTTWRPLNAQQDGVRQIFEALSPPQPA